MINFSFFSKLKIFHVVYVEKEARHGMGGGLLRRPCDQNFRLFRNFQLKLNSFFSSILYKFLWIWEIPIGPFLKFSKISRKVPFFILIYHNYPYQNFCLNSCRLQSSTYLTLSKLKNINKRAQIFHYSFGGVLNT